MAQDDSASMDITQGQNGAQSSGRPSTIPIRNSAFLLVIVCIVILGSVPIPVAAQDGVPSSEVPLDSEAEQVGTVEIQRQTYTIYRFDNHLPYAGGVEVYKNGKQVQSEAELDKVFRVLAAKQVLEEEGVANADARARAITSKSKAQEVFREIGWRKAARQLGTEDIETLRDIQQTTKDIEETTSTALNGVNSILDLIEWMKDTNVGPVNVWDAATSYAPVLTEFEASARELKTELEEWNSAAEEVNKNIPEVINAIEKIENDEEVDYAALSEKFATTMAALDRLQTKSDDLSSRLSQMSSMSAEVASAVEEVPSVGSELAREFESLSTTLDSAADDVESFSATLEEQQARLKSVKQTAESKQSELMTDWQNTVKEQRDSWKARQSAEMKVYGTLGGSGSVLVGGLGLLLKLRLW